VHVAGQIDNTSPACYGQNLWKHRDLCIESIEDHRVNGTPLRFELNRKRLEVIEGVPGTLRVACGLDDSLQESHRARSILNPIID
jgi:hypothetical protein